MAPASPHPSNVKCSRIVAQSWHMLSCHLFLSLLHLVFVDPMSFLCLRVRECYDCETGGELCQSPLRCLPCVNTAAEPWVHRSALCCSFQLKGKKGHVHPSNFNKQDFNQLAVFKDSVSLKHKLYCRTCIQFGCFGRSLEICVWFQCCARHWKISINKILYWYPYFLVVCKDNK